jgi:glycosyltransferase involved in cell wall biosynthesis
MAAPSATRGPSDSARILVIVPALDEVESLPHTLDRLEADAPGLAVLVVDDGSQDGTSHVARDRGIPVVRHPFNLGVGAALQTGFRYAVAHGFDVGVQLDADGQHDPRDLAALVQPVVDGRCDVAIGSRYVASTGYRAPAARRAGMLLFSGIVRLIVGQRITDTTSGFRAYGRSAMEFCQHEFPRDFPDAPLLITLARRGLRLLEVPVHMRERERGRSFYTLGKSLYYPYKNLLTSLMAWLQRPGR